MAMRKNELRSSMGNNWSPATVCDRPLETSFVRDGFALFESFVNKVELKEIVPLVESVLTSSHELACTRPNNTLAPLRWNDPIVRLLLESDHRVQALTAVLRADDLRWISGYVSIKEPHSPPLWWHQDWWCWDHPVSYRRMAPQIAVLCYLADANAQNGALRVLRGSHLKSTPIHAVLPEAHGHSAEGLPPGHIALSDLPGQVTLCLQAGDAVVIDYRLLHSTHGNASNTRRDCILLSFTPSWRGLPNDIKAHLIAHPAQPSGGEALKASSMPVKLFPKFSGSQRDLPLNRNAPSNFEVVD